MYVIYTRATHPTSGKLYEHVYGTYETRSKATTAKKRLYEDAKMVYGKAEADKVYMKITKIIDTQAFHWA